MFQKKKKKAKKQRTKPRNDEEGQEEKEVKGKGECRKENSHLVCLSVCRLKLASGKDQR